MLFRSRTHSWVLMLIAFIWPKKGFIRGWIYLALRELRLRSSDYSLAAGLACGAFASFTPFLGVHIIIAAGLAWLIGGNMVMALIGTFVGNPWTFPFIWASTYAMGSWILGLEQIIDDLTQLNFSLLMAYPGQVFYAMTIGSLVLGVPFAVMLLGLCYASAGHVRVLFQVIKQNRMKKIRLKRKTP